MSGESAGPLELQTIGIAVVEQLDRVLIGVRGNDGPLAGSHEFPGGKCLAAEASEDCARRECLEETGLDVVPVRLLLQRRFRYDHAEVELFFWLCRPVDDVSANVTQQHFRWVPKSELTGLEFPAANQPVIELLVADSA